MVKRWIKKSYANHKKLKIFLTGVFIVALIFFYVLFATPYYCAMLVRAVF